MALLLLLLHLHLCLSLNIRNIINNSSRQAVESGPFGGSGGSHWTDEDQWLESGQGRGIAGMEVGSGSSVDSIRVTEHAEEGPGAI